MTPWLRTSVIISSMVAFVYACSSEDPAEPSTSSSSQASSSSSSGVGSTAGATSTSTSTGAGGGYACNPVTNEPCGPGEACDFADGGGFTCYPANAGNTQTACETCDGNGGPFCMGGFTCPQEFITCKRFCCTDADCGPSLLCNAIPAYSPLGLCLDPQGGSEGGAGGGGGAGGMGGNPAPSGPGCDDIPAVNMPPSMGACVTVAPP